MKTKGHKAFASLRAGVVATVAAALVITPLAVANSAEVPTFGKRCTTEGVSTGQKTTSLICAEGSNGKLTWQRVRLGSSKAAPVAALTPPKGAIEFHHWRGEDRVVLQSIIDKYEARYPGTKINQVVMTSGDYGNLALTRISANPKAAVFVTMRGGQFDNFYKAGLLKDLSSQRYAQQNFIQSALTPGTVDGKIFGLPYQSLFNNPIYNAELFQKQGWKVPTTWSQTLAFCKTAKAAGFIPFAWPGGTRGNAGQILNAFMMNSAPYATVLKNATDIDKGRADLTGDWFTGIAKQYKQMADAGCFPANATGYTDTVAPADFAAGKAAIYPTGTFGMSSVTRLNPAMAGKMKIFGLITTDSKPYYEGITNNTFILSVNTKSSATDQRIANSFISFLATAPIAQEYAVGTSQHVSVINVDYSANPDLLNTSDIMGKKLLLAPRFLFLNQGVVRDKLEDALIAIVGGADITKTLADTSKIIKQGLGA